MDPASAAAIACHPRWTARQHACYLPYSCQEFAPPSCPATPPNQHWLRPCLQAPELFLNPQALTPACDAWSFGIVLYELLTWQAPHSLLCTTMCKTGVD